MPTSDPRALDFALSGLDVRALARRAALPAVLAIAAVTAVVLLQSHVHVLADSIRRVLDLNPGWALAAIVLECLSLAGYVALLWLVAGRAAPTIGARESAQITFAGAAATRLLPTAGAGGLALALWALRQAGLRPRAATRTLLAFLVVLYSVFLAAIVFAGAVLALGLVGNHGPRELSAVAATGAAIGILACLALGSRRREETDAVASDELESRGYRGRISASARLLGDAVRDALGLLRTGDARLAGAIAYWMLDAAVLWAMLHAFGSAPALPVVVLAYFVGQVANTLPLPGSVSGGIGGVLIAFGVSSGMALPAVLAYRTVAVWLPTPAAIAAVPALRATIARWRRDARAPERPRSVTESMPERDRVGNPAPVVVGVH
jgi:uncharacterized membrane protein YbhN (UPF0104 family)